MDSAWDQSSIWFRVDDRLIHGQVTVAWRQYLRYADIWVVDEQARGDPYLQDALRLAAPDGVAVRVYGIDEAVAALAVLGQRRAARAGPTPVGPTNQEVTEAPRVRGILLLVRSPGAALALVEGGVPLDRLNVGNLSARPGSVRAFKNISLTLAHVEALDALAAYGVRITFQLTPEDAQADWQTVRRRVMS